MIALAAALLGATIGTAAVGNDAATVADAQLFLEKGVVRVPETRVGSYAAIAGAFPADPPAGDAAAADAAKKQAAALLDEATKAYFEGKLPTALDRLSALATLHEQSGFLPVADAVRMHLWRVAVFRKLNDEVNAQEAALAALALAPTLEVKLTDFPPSVVDSVTRAKPLLRTATLILPNLSGDVAVKVDDRAVKLPATLPLGRHRLSLSAPSRRTLSFTLDLTGDRSMAIALPPALPQTTVDRVVGLAGADAPLDAVLGTAAVKAGVDGWVFAVAEPGRLRGVLVSQNGTVSRSAPLADGNALSEWAAAAVREMLRNPAGSARAWSVAVVPSLGYATRTRDAGGAFEAVFDGARAGVAANGSWKFVRGESELSLTNFVSTLDVTAPDGQAASVGGGNLVGFSLLGGVGHGFAGGKLDLSLLAGVQHESMLAAPLSSSYWGGDSGLLSSWSSTDGHAEAALKFRAGPLGVGIAGGFSQPLAFSETPAGASGSDPVAAGFPTVRAGLSWENPIGGWRAALTLASRTRSVDFTGAGLSDSPQLTDATVTESLTTVTLSASKSF